MVLREIQQKKLKSLIVNMTPSSQFEARVVLEEMQDEEYPETTLRSMSICMAPAETMQTYLQGMIFESQDHTARQLGVDTAKYFLCVDNRMNTLHTGAEGYWGGYQEMTRTINDKTYLDAAILTIACCTLIGNQQEKGRQAYEKSECRRD